MLSDFERRVPPDDFRTTMMHFGTCGSLGAPTIMDTLSAIKAYVDYVDKYNGSEMTESETALGTEMILLAAKSLSESLKSLGIRTVDFAQVAELAARY